MTDNQIIRMILVDDHRRVHQAMAEMIDFIDDIELLAQASNGEEAVHLCDQYQPDLVLMDVVMPVMDGVEATKRIMAKHPNIKILALSSFKDPTTVREMLENGAIGYVLKESSVDDLEHTIRTAYEGQGVLSPEVIHGLLDTQEEEPTPEPQIDNNLSPRELEVLQLFATGMTNGEIAVDLTISVSTVKFHISNILDKLEVDTRAEALVLAAKNNLI